MVWPLYSLVATAFSESIVILQTGSTTFMIPPRSGVGRLEKTLVPRPAPTAHRATSPAALQTGRDGLHGDSQPRALGLALRTDQDDAGDTLTLDALHVPTRTHRLLNARQPPVTVPAAPLAGRADGV